MVLFSWKADTPQQKVTEIESAFCLLQEKIPEIHAFEWGTDVSIEGLAQGMSHCLLVSFNSETDRQIYLPHPAHEEFVKLIQPHLEDVLVFDYWQRS